jgi:hypothetical protein
MGGRTARTHRATSGSAECAGSGDTSHGSGDHTLLLTVPRAAKILGISCRRLYTLAATPGAMPEGVVVRLGRRVYLSRKRLEAWLGHSEGVYEFGLGHGS